jgi:hypothetical protein
MGRLAIVCQCARCCSSTKTRRTSQYSLTDRIGWFIRNSLRLLLLPLDARQEESPAPERRAGPGRSIRFLVAKDRSAEGSHGSVTLAASPSRTRSMPVNPTENVQAGFAASSRALRVPGPLVKYRSPSSQSAPIPAAWGGRRAARSPGSTRCPAAPGWPPAGRAACSRATAGIRSGPGWSPRPALGRASLTSDQGPPRSRPRRAYKSERVQRESQLSADPARPIRPVTAAAPQPGPVRLGCHGLVAEPHPVEDGGEHLVSESSRRRHHRTPAKAADPGRRMR